MFSLNYHFARLCASLFTFQICFQMTRGSVMHFTFSVVIDSGYHSLEKTLMIAYQLCWEIIESDLGL